MAAGSRNQGPNISDHSDERNVGEGVAVAEGGGAASGTATADPTEATPTPSVLYLPGDSGPRADAERPIEPAYFGDLNLDHVVAAVVTGFEQYDLAPYFQVRLPDQDAVRYRQEVFADLERGDVLEAVDSFSRSMVQVRAHLAEGARIGHDHERARRILDAALVYSEAVGQLCGRLADGDIGSRALRRMTTYLSSYVESQLFVSMVEESVAVRERLGTIRYSVHLKGLRVGVRRYGGETDYSTEVQKTFERFRQGAVHEYRVGLREWPEMNHVEAQILDRVALLYPEEFAALHAFVERWGTFVDPPIAVFDREIQFYVSYVRWLAPLRAAGLRFSFPEVGPRPAETFAAEAFDVALADKLVDANAPVVTNDFRLVAPERILVVTGPNQGGKTTFARMVGQLHHLAALGCPVPGTHARLTLCDEIFTHFEREEDLGVTGGKLEDDLVRIRDILLRATTNSVVVVNEIFTSTTLDDATFLGRQVLGRLTELGPLCVYVTFVDELASLGDSTVSMVSTVDPGDPSRRTFKVVQRPADGRSYAIAIAEKYGLTYEQLRKRMSR